MYVPNTLGQPGNLKNGPIWLKFGKLAHLMNPWVFFSFFENFDFLGLGTSFFFQKEAKTLRHPGDFKDGRIWLKFCTLVPHHRSNNDGHQAGR